MEKEKQMSSLIEAYE